MTDVLQLSGGSVAESTNLKVMYILDWRLPAPLVAIYRAANTRDHNRIADAPKEAGRQIAIAYSRLAARNRTDVVARPRKAIPLCDDDPRSPARQAKITPNGLRHFDRHLIASRGLGGQRHDVHLIDPILLTGHQNDGDGPVLYTFIAAFNVLVFPQVAVVQNLAGFRKR